MAPWTAYKKLPRGTDSCQDESTAYAPFGSENHGARLSNKADSLVSDSAELPHEPDGVDARGAALAGAELRINAIPNGC